jgi:hypothetical protein
MEHAPDVITISTSAGNRVREMRESVLAAAVLSEQIVYDLRNKHNIRRALQKEVRETEGKRNPLESSSIKASILIGSNGENWFILDLRCRFERSTKQPCWTRISKVYLSVGWQVDGSSIGRVPLDTRNVTGLTVPLARSRNASFQTSL